MIDPSLTNGAPLRYAAPARSDLSGLSGKSGSLVLIMVYYIMKLVMEFQFDLQNPLKQPKMLIFEKCKIIVFGQNYGIFWPIGDLKPSILKFWSVTP